MTHGRVPLKKRTPEYYEKRRMKRAKNREAAREAARKYAEFYRLPTKQEQSRQLLYCDLLITLCHFIPFFIYKSVHILLTFF